MTNWKKHRVLIFGVTAVVVMLIFIGTITMRPNKQVENNEAVITATESAGEEPGIYDPELSQPVDANKTTMLMLSSRNGEVDKIVEILDRGGNPNDIDVFGQTALTQAVMMNRVDAVKQLIEAGADVNVQRNDGYTPLMLAVIDNRVEIINLLLEAGADVSALDHQGNDALILSVQYILHRKTNSLEVPQKLIEAGADVNLINKNGHSALLYARDESHEGLVSLLEENGAVAPKHPEHDAHSDH